MHGKYLRHYLYYFDIGPCVNHNPDDNENCSTKTVSFKNKTLVQSSVNKDIESLVFMTNCILDYDL